MLAHLRTELANTSAEMGKERERREQAEAQALRSGVRLETLEQLLAQLRPDRAGATPDAISSGESANA